MKEYFLKRKVCIVGSGFCGYAAYKKLKSENIDLIVVEGGKETTPISNIDQKFYNVFTNKFLSFEKNNKVRNNIDPSFRDRKFTLGGSSECWSGWIKPFEESTYQNYYIGDQNQNWGDLRLSKFDKEVLKLLNSPIDNFDVKDLSKKLNIKLPSLKNGLKYSTYAWAKENLTLKGFWTNKINNDLKFDHQEKIKDLVLDYKLFDYNKSDGKIKNLKFINHSNNSILILEAEYFVLCMGGIENARFIKKIINDNNLDKKIKSYVGNFQEHPHFYNIAYFNKGEKALPNILCKRLNISNRSHSAFKNGSVKVAISAWDGPGTPKVTFSIIENKNKNIINGLKNIIKKPLGKETIPSSDYLINMRCEQTRNDNSKLEFLKNKTFLNWQVNDTDFKYYSNYLKRLAAFLISENYAKGFNLRNPSAKNFAIPKSIWGGAHHMSTVPYLKNKILINENFQLSIFKNTYVVGSSAFPVSGFENPTHTAISTSLRSVEDILYRIDKNL